MSQQLGAILLLALGGMGQRQLSIFFIFFSLPPPLPAEFPPEAGRQNRKIFQFLFLKGRAQNFLKN